MGSNYARLGDKDALTYADLQRAGEYARFLEQVEMSLDSITPKVKKEITEVVRKTYEACYDGMVNAAEEVSDVSELYVNLKGIRAVPPEVIKRIVENPIAGLTLDDRLKKHRQDVVYNIKQVIGNGLAQGDRYSTMAKRISEQLDMDYRKAIRIVRTETHRVKEAGIHDAATEIDTVLKDESDLRMVKIWRTMKDEAVRPQRKAYRRRAGAKARKKYTAGKRSYVGGPNHVKMEGIIVLADEDFDLGDGVKTPAPGQSGVAGHDINCRCFIEYDMMNDAEYFKATGKHFVAETEVVGLKKKIQKIKDKIASNNGTITEDNIKSAGKVVQEELLSARAPLKKKFDDLTAEYENLPAKKLHDKLVKQQKAIRDEYYNLPYNDARKHDLYDEYAKLDAECIRLFKSEELINYRKKIRAARTEYYGTWEFNAGELKSKLSEVRVMGIGNHNMNKEQYSNRGSLRDVVTTAFDHYPSDWVEKSIKSNKIDVLKVNRGYNNKYEIAISGHSKDSQMETAFHELGHRFEIVVDGILDAEKAFYERRTKGEDLAWLGAPYAKSEKTRRDKFLDPYIGKDYYGRAYEIVSMGFQYAYYDPTKLWEDEDFAQFIYGILALY